MATTMEAASRPAGLPPAKSRPSSTFAKAAQCDSSSSVIGNTRTSSEAGLDDSQRSPSQTKRRRVEFDLDSNTVLNIAESTERKLARSKIRVEIEQALSDHKKRDNQGYDCLKERFSDNPSYELLGDEIEDPNSIATLRTYLEVLVGFTRHLNRSCDGLVKTILKYPWLDRDSAFVQTYTDFLASILLTQGPTYTELVFGSLVEHFLELRAKGIMAVRQVTRPTARKRLHAMIQYLLQYFPMATPTLRAMITHKFPFADDSRRTHVAYLNHLLRLQGYAKILKNSVMDLILDRLLKLDVRMQLDLEDLDDERTAKVLLAVQQAQKKSTNTADDHEDSSDLESLDDDDDEEERDEEAEQIFAMKSNVEKMDSILDCLFVFFAPRFTDATSDDAFSVFSDLLGDFVRLILPTYKSRHTQFLLFHFGQRSNRLIDAFCGTCVNIAFESNQPVPIRRAAAAYLASFVARGSRVPKEMVQGVFELVAQHLEGLRDRYSQERKRPDLQKYGDFYSLFQALLYVFCFRWRDLVQSTSEPVDEDDPLSYLNQKIYWVRGVRETFSKAIFSPLNPLKVCAPVIVEEFAKLSWRLDFLYVSTIIESNRRIRLSHFSTHSYSAYGNGALRESGLNSDQESSYQLEAYFPFDPYQLPTSKRWVEDDYIQWRGFPDMNAEIEEVAVDDGGDQDQIGGDDYEVVGEGEDTATYESEEED